MGRESEIETAVCRYAKTKGCYVRKFSSPSNVGVPDRLFITPGGVVFFVEFKAPGKHPTALQWREIGLIEKNNGNAFWADSIERGKTIVDHFLKLKVRYAENP